MNGLQSEKYNPAPQGSRNLTLFLLGVTFVFLLSGCMPSTSSSRSGIAGSKGGEGVGGDDDKTPDPGLDSSEVSWYHRSSETKGTLTVHQDLESVFYLMGEGTHQFLASSGRSDHQFCLVIPFSLTVGGAKRQLRLLATPEKKTNFQTGRIDWKLRINGANSSVSSNQAYCQGEVDGVSASTEIAYQLSDLCGNCTGLVSANPFSLYLSSDGRISDSYLIESTEISFSGLSFRIDMESSTDPPTNSSCTTESCQAQDMDCCIEGQCVNDKTLRPNATTHADYAEAVAQVAADVTAYERWSSSIYYVCPFEVAPDPDDQKTPTDPNITEEEARLKLATLTSLYNCISGAQGAVPDYSGCSPTDATGYATAQSSMWDECNCPGIGQAAPDDAATVCANYTLRAETDGDGNIIRVYCSTYTPNEQPDIYSDKAYVMSKMAPHLFYDTDGNHQADLDTYVAGLDTNAADPIQEGDTFLYLNDDKTQYDAAAFSINAIVGQMSVGLDQAYPALRVQLQHGMTYIISAVDGYYTTCDTCSTDQWNEAFTAFPPSTKGRGLHAKGFTTARSNLQDDDFFTTNESRGNYEDTIFGRACWMPPTMIPFSHYGYGTLQTQRQNRLKTQAALFVNGYQRDWFGFNLGAVIGSFDGITWFAVGGGRRVTATSNNLYLAINSPYADLATRTITTVHIVQDLGFNLAANHDYEPTLSLTDEEQNSGATCQRWHQCEVDEDCVTQLGWEYMCVDVSQVRTLWPSFDIDGVEQTGTGNDRTLVGGQMLFSRSLPSGSTKRCVYRGAGAPCSTQDYTNFTDSDHRKLATCAPNFYCATIDSNGVFNSEVNRSVKLQDDDFLYGQEANALGRPFNYLSGGESLNSSDTVITTNLAANSAIFVQPLTDTETGLCRPGKSLGGTTSEPYDHQVARDINSRTDYISQLSSCNSGETGVERVITCPMFLTSGDYKGEYTHIQNSTTFTNITYSTTYAAELRAQNACGAPSLYDHDDDTNTAVESTFRNIEADTIGTTSAITSPMIVKDACFRRAGAVCHTNLDCSPNFLHGGEADNYETDTTAFGSTEAELNYWKEYLVCGQAESEPQLTSANYYTYDMTKNKCCRGYGKEFTMYTQGDPETNSKNANLNVSIIPNDDPSATGRYSRYSVLSNYDTSITSASVFSANQNADGSIINAPPPIVDYSTPDVPTPAQWKTFNDTGQKTCCGGGWIRKFADGTFDWSKSKMAERLQLPVQNFACINFTNPLFDTEPSRLSGTRNYNNQQGLLCQGHPNGYDDNPPVGSTGFFSYACLQDSINTNGQTIIPPVIADNAETNTKSVTINTFRRELSPDAPFLPIPYDNTNGSANNENITNAYLLDSGFDEAAFYLPIYINAPANSCTVPGPPLNALNIDSVASYRVANDESTQADGAALGCVTTCTDAIAPGNGEYCIYDNALRDRILRVKYSDEDPNFRLGLTISFSPIGDHSHSSAGGPISEVQRALPGNDLYYLDKLERFELIGIPQIYYEPIYCNSDYDQLVQGLFNTDGDERTDFNDASYSFDATASYTTQTPSGELLSDNANSTHNIVFSTDSTGNVNKLQFDAIWSSHEFKCCLQVGAITTNDEKCCSGLSKEDKETKDLNGNTVRRCKIPDGTNLHLYTNRFISGEAMFNEDTGDGFKDSEYDERTGYLKREDTITSRLVAFGEQHCSSGAIRFGGAFGSFPGEPNPGRVYFPEIKVPYGILDSASPAEFETDEAGDRGYLPFMEGFRWNHHVYCDNSQQGG